MKTLFVLTIILLTQHSLFSQGVGINTTSPDPSAALDIQSTNKGILIPKISLNSLADKTTISSPANSLLIYNTNPNLAQGIGFYFNTNTPAFPVWKSLSDWKLPYYGADSEPAVSFLIENYHGGQNSSAIKGYSGGSGTGVHARSDGGVALKAEGGVKIFGNGQNPGAGKVLTSDENGKATWEGAVAFRVNGILSGGSEKIAANATTKVAFFIMEYDLGNNFNGINDSPFNTFIAPTKGIYHFDVQVSWDKINGGLINASLEELLFEHALELKKIGAGGTSVIAANEVQTYNQNSNQLSVDVLLEEGDQIFTTFTHHFGSYLFLRLGNNALNYFSGRLVIKQ